MGDKGLLTIDIKEEENIGRSALQYAFLISPDQLSISFRLPDLLSKSYCRTIVSSQFVLPVVLISISMEGLIDQHFGLLASLKVTANRTSHKVYGCSIRS